MSNEVIQNLENYLTVILQGSDLAPANVINQISGNAWNDISAAPLIGNLILMNVNILNIESGHITVGHYNNGWVNLTGHAISPTHYMDIS